MAEIASGDTVRIHYTGTLTDGTVFDSSEGKDPLEFQVGVGHVIKGLDDALMGMAEGARKVVDIPVENAYGAYVDGRKQSFPRSMIPDTVPLQVGGQLQMQTQDGRVIVMQVLSFDDETVEADANHPLAGKDLRFDFEVVAVLKE